MRTHDRGRGIVAAGHGVTAEAAAEVLRAGGNAFDAAIAGLWAACVAEPVLASPAGGGFLLAHPASGSSELFDFFVHTPSQRRGAEAVSFYEVHVDFGVATQAFHVGLGAAAVPGFVRGLFDVHRALGSVPMPRLVEPAVHAARRGVDITEYQAYLLSVVAPIYKISEEVMELFCHPPSGPGEVRQLKGAGERIVNEKLAASLEHLGRGGDRLFYEGELAAAIGALCRDGGGHLTVEDLAAYQTVTREPLERQYRGAKVLFNPPPSAGGALIAFSLDLLSRVDVPGMEAGSPAHAALLADVMRATSRAREEISSGGTPELDRIDDALVARYAAEVVGAAPSTRGTTHVSVIDGEGNAAAATVSNGEGCGQFVPEAGFMLNNMLGEEDLVGAGALAHWPTNHRLSSMMAPTAIRFADSSLAVLGSGGSNRIRTAILQVVSQLIDGGATPERAVEAARIHLEGEHLDFEALLPEATRLSLARSFSNHTSWPERNMFFGGVHVAMRRPDGTLLGAGDPRRAGVVVQL